MNIIELKASAEAASKRTPGIWLVSGDDYEVIMHEDGRYFCDLHNAIFELLAEIESLRAENAQLRKDADRYQWLRSRPVDDVCSTPRIEVNLWTCNENDEGICDSVNEGSVLAGGELDSMIDAAKEK